MGLLDFQSGGDTPGFMSGLLGGGQWTADKGKNSAIEQSLLQAAFGLLSARKGNFAQKLGQAGMQGMQSYDAQLQQQRQNKMQDLQFGQMKTEADRKTRADEQQRNLDSLAQQFTRPGAKPETMDNRDVGQPGEAAIPARQVDLPGLAQAYMGAPGGMDRGLHLMQAQQKDNTPLVVPDGGMLVSRDGTMRIENPKAVPDKTPEALRSLKMIYGEGSPQYVKAAQEYAKKLTTHQPAASLTVNAEKPLVNDMAVGLGKQLDASLAGANAAQQAIGSAQRIGQLVASGKVVTGAGSDWRTTALRIGDALGVGGASTQEKLANTSELMRNLAQGELTAAQQMKGQGQITEAERDILRKAASGDMNMSPAELTRLSQTVEKTARSRIAQHQSNVQKLRGVPGAAPLLPFYDVATPPDAPAPAAGARRYNPDTGRIE